MLLLLLLVALSVVSGASARRRPRPRRIANILAGRTDSSRACKVGEDFGECAASSWSCTAQKKGRPSSQRVCPGSSVCCLERDAPSSSSTPADLPPAPPAGSVPSYIKLGDSQTGCPMPRGKRVALRGSSATGPCVGFVGAHADEIMRTGIPMVRGQNVVVYLGSNDVRGYSESSVARKITEFVAAARSNNVRILAWAGPSIPMSNRSPSYTDEFFRSRLGDIPYLSLMQGGFPMAGDHLHFTPTGYAQIKRAIDARIARAAGGQGSADQAAPRSPAGASATNPQQ